MKPKPIRNSLDFMLRSIGFFLVSQRMQRCINVKIWVKFTAYKAFRKKQAQAVPV